MRQQHRLGVLQVGQAGRGRAPGAAAPGPISAVSSSASRDDHQPGVVAQVEPQVGGDLVVAAAAGPQLARRATRPARAGRAPAPCARPRRSPPAGTAPSGRPGRGRPGRGQQPGQLGVVQQPGLVQHPGVRAGGEQVVRRQPPVELDAHRQPGQRLGRPGLEPAAPQPDRRAGSWSATALLSLSDAMLTVASASHASATAAGDRTAAGPAQLARPAACRSRSAAILLGRPHSSTKPLASDWSNTSPVS